MDTKKLRIFTTAAECGSLTETAKVFETTQGGVSHIIKDLETITGLSLLLRGKKGVSLTPSGKIIYPLIKNIIKEEDELLKKIEELQGLKSGTISIGTFTSIATHFLPQIIKEFNNNYPNINFKLLNSDYGDIENWIQKRNVDVAFISLPTKQKCKTIPLFDDELFAILPKNHPLSEQKELDINDIIKDDFITLLKSSNHDFRRVVDKKGLKLNIRFTSKDDYAVIAMVKQGLGVSIMPGLLLKNHDDGIVVKHLKERVYRTIALAVLGDENNPLINKFASFVKDFFALSNDL